MTTHPRLVLIAPVDKPDLFVIPRILIAVVLLVAAGLKLYQLSTAPLPGTGFMANRWVNLLESDCEIVLALWLLSGWRRKIVWILAMASFVMFIGLTAPKYFAGAASCGCFGAMKVPPLVTLTLDASIVLLLVFLRPHPHAPPPSNHMRLVVGAIVAGMIVVATAIPVICYSPSRLIADGTLVGADRTVLLEPDEWVGQALPIRKHIDIADELGHGEWTVVLIHHGCAECRTVVTELAGKAKAVGPGKAARIALIQLPPYGDSMNDILASEPLFLNGKLDESQEWFASTPVVLRLRDGLVTSARFAQGEASRKAALAEAVPVIQVADTEHDFGPVAAGSRQAVTFKISNPTPTSVAIRGVVCESPCLTAKNCPKRIAPYSFALVEVEFIPSHEATFRSARVVIQTDDPKRSEIVLTVRASAGR